MFMPFIPQPGLPSPIVLAYSGNNADVDIFAAAGSPVGPVTVIVNMADSTVFYASTTSNYACDCNGFVSGSTVTFNMINSTMDGDGGAGGAGGTGTANGSAGGAGGPSIRLGCDTTFNETGTSTIRGGGGGGGGDGGSRNCTSAADNDGFCSCTGCTNSTGSAGGAGQHWDTAAGTRGGAFGTAGTSGSSGSGSTSGCAPNCGHGQGSGGAGGAAGGSIKTQSNSYTLNTVATTGSIVA